MRALVLLWTLGSLLEETRPWGFRNGIFHNSIWLGEDTGTPAVGGGREGERGTTLGRIIGRGRFRPSLTTRGAFHWSEETRLTGIAFKARFEHSEHSKYIKCDRTRGFLFSCFSLGINRRRGPK